MTESCPAHNPWSFLFMSRDVFDFASLWKCEFIVSIQFETVKKLVHFRNKTLRLWQTAFGLLCTVLKLKLSSFPFEILNGNFSSWHLDGLIRKLWRVWLLLNRLTKVTCGLHHPQTVPTWSSIPRRTDTVVLEERALKSSSCCTSFFSMSQWTAESGEGLFVLLDGHEMTEPLWGSLAA